MIIFQIMLNFRYKGWFFIYLINFLMIAPMDLSIAQSEKIDSLKSLIESAGSDTALTNYYFELSDAYLRKQIDSSKKYLEKGLEISQNPGNEKYHLKGLNLKCTYWLDRGQGDSALLASNEALSFMEYGDNRQKFNALHNRGRSLQTNSRLDEAVEWYLKSLELAERLKVSSMIISVLSNLGTVYWELGDYDNALKYYEQSLEISEKEKFQLEAASNLGNIGLIYRQKGDSQKALQSYMKSNEIFEELGDKFHRAINHQNIGVLYEEQELWSRAVDNFEMSNNLSKEIDDKIGVALTTINLAVIDGKTKKYTRSIKLLDSALTYSKRINYKPAIKEAYFAMSEVYSEWGKYKEALEARRNFEVWKDSLLNESYLNKISDLEARYEFEKKQNEILALSEENLIKQASIETKNFWIRLLFVAVFFILCTGVLSVVMVRQRMRYKNKEMVFEAVSRTEIKEQHRIARDLHDSIGAMLAIVKNKISGIDQKKINEETRNELQEVTTLVNKTSEETRRISHNMIPEDLLKFGLVSATESLMENLKSNAKVNMECSHFGMEERLDQVKELNIFRIIQELIQNSLKHADPQNININFTRHKEYLNIIMQDDGKGFPGTETKSGMGLANVQSRLNFLKAKWQVDSSQNTGTSFVLDIPVRS